MSPPSAEDVSIEAVDDTTAILVPDILTIDSVEALRTKSGKLRAGTAAKADIELFKGLGRHAQKSKAKRWDRKQASQSSHSYASA